MTASHVSPIFPHFVRCRPGDAPRGNAPRRCQSLAFCEYADTKPRKTPTWFALADDRPLALFAGIWTIWHGTRGTKASPVVGEHQPFGFLTTDANAEVGAVHPKAMPVILTTDAEIEQWMTAPAEDALELQRPLPDGALRIVATGEKEDQAA